MKTTGPVEASVVVTYRCNSRCAMCHSWKNPSDKAEEVTLATLEKLPQLRFVNITGGEPFLRDDIGSVLDIVGKKARRVVVSTNGFLTDRIAQVMTGREKRVGVRISIDGMKETHDRIRGVNGAFDRAMATLEILQGMGVRDLGFGATVSDRNASDLLSLFNIAKRRNVEFAIAAVHNGYYFFKDDNTIDDRDRVAGELDKLITEYLRTYRPKNWFRAYMAAGIINYVYGRSRLLPCEMGTLAFFLDPYGEVKPCNVMDATMGNLHEKTFEELWDSNEAQDIRCRVASCNKHCWMVGSASPAMHKHVLRPIAWVLKNRLTRGLIGKNGAREN